MEPRFKVENKESLKGEIHSRKHIVFLFTIQTVDVKIRKVPHFEL